MKKCFLTIFIFMGMNSHAVTSSGLRTIENMGCHNTDTTCYVYVSGDPVGPPSCRSTSIRWNKEIDPNGEAMLSLLMAAFYANKKVSFGLKDDCYAYQAGYPTINHINVQK